MTDSEAELFGLGIISSIWGLHSTAVFSPGGNEVYWAPMMMFPGETYSRGGLLTMKRVNGRWTAPAWASFSGPDIEDDVPFFSPDGERMYFISRRPLPGKTEAGSEKIWWVDRTATGWSEPRPLDEAVNSQQMRWQFSLDQSGNLYFPSSAPGGFGMDDIYTARITAGKYEKPVNLGEPINSAAGETTPFIAPDGSYLIISRQYDLWVSFRNADGAWSAPVGLGPEVNSPEIELCPMVTADGKYLFFLSQRDGESHVYWISATVIEKARPRSTSDHLDSWEHPARNLSRACQCRASRNQVSACAAPTIKTAGVKQASPFKYTAIAQLANGSIGYVPTRQAWTQGNYEVVSARCGAGSGELLVETASRLLCQAAARR